MTGTALITQIKKRFTEPLPGRLAQYKMAHAVRKDHPPAPANARVACVLPLLYPREGQWHIVLIERMSTNKNDRHSGQISFPGGKLEPTDASLMAGALREAEEEVGINSQEVEVLGQLTDLYIPVSNFLVHPFVGKMDYQPEFEPQPSEVQSILEVPLKDLLNPQRIKKTDMKLSPQLTLRNVPYYHLENHIVWGATAMILSELVDTIGDFNP